MSNRKKLYCKSALMAVSAALPLMLSGCAGFETTAPQVNSLSTTATITGHIHGGQQAISGATVQLFAAGTTGYGSAATLYATTTTANDGAGSFAFSKSASNIGATAPTTPVWGCPATGNPQMYLLATGGNTQGSGTATNSAAASIIPLGACSGVTASMFLFMNEVTTAGTLIALQQYFNPNTLQLGAPSTTQGQLGFANAVASVANLVNVTTGAVQTTTTPVSTVVGVTMTATPESAKINTLGNITAACVNSATAGDIGCTTLFTNAIPPSPSVTSQPGLTFSTATNTLAALYYMLTNPTESQDNGTTGKLANLYNLPTATSPFQPGLTTQPLDWTVGIAYTPSGTCTNANNGSFASTVVYGGAVDAAGNFWFANAEGTSALPTGTLAVVSPTGAPIDCQIGTLSAGRAVSIDTVGNVFVSNNVASSNTGSRPIFKTTLKGTAVGFTTAATPYWSTLDGSGNLFYETIGGLVYKIPSAATATATSPGDVQIYANTAGGGSTHYYLSADASSRIWSTNTTTILGSYQVNLLFPTTDSTAVNGYLGSNVGDSSSSTTGYPYNAYGAVAFDNSGNGFLANGCCSVSVNANSVAKITPAATSASATSATATVATSVRYAGGNSAVRSVAVDGAGNVWLGNSNASSGTLYALSEVDNNLNSLSPLGTTPATCASGACPTSGGFQKTGLGTVRALGIDPSGNVWAGTSNGVIYEMVGTAVPVVTPLAAGMAANKLGAKP